MLVELSKRFKEGGDKLDSAVVGFFKGHCVELCNKGGPVIHAGSILELHSPVLEEGSSSVHASIKFRDTCLTKGVLKDV